VDFYLAGRRENASLSLFYYARIFLYGDPIAALEESFRYLSFVSFFERIICIFVDFRELALIFTSDIDITRVKLLIDIKSILIIFHILIRHAKVIITPQQDAIIFFRRHTWFSKSFLLYVCRNKHLSRLWKKIFVFHKFVSSWVAILESVKMWKQNVVRCSWFSKRKQSRYSERLISFNFDQAWGR